MCGIAGIWNRNEKPVRKQTLEAMLRILAHRGREGTGYFIEDDIGLAHNRMRVIDLTEQASQPMSGADGRYQVVFNGEIHNYRELRDDLVKAGWVFRSDSDTEVVLAGYATWGAECFERFNGMWGIAILDRIDRKLIISRDRFGIKPVFYAIRNNELVFASEAKAIASVFPKMREPDFEKLYGYLDTGATNIGQGTFYKNIKSLSPGCFLRITADKIETVRYWSFKPGIEAPINDAVEQFRELLTDATRIRLRSDVPIASWVSGGLDSSVVTRIAGSLMNTPLQCYSLRYANPAEDESSYAAAVADDQNRYPINWVTPEKHDSFDVIEKIVHHHDGPTPMRGRYAMWHIASQTAGNQVVVLNGDGADEILGGYGFFLAPYFFDRIRNPSMHRDDQYSILKELSLLAQVQGRGVFSTARRLVTPWLFRYGARYRRCENLFANSFSGEYAYWDASQHQAGWACKHNFRHYKSDLNNALWHEFAKRGLPELLHGTDSISMAHTLETRSPFLDHRIVEFCFSLPYNEKIGDGFTKRLLRKAFGDILPPSVRDRREKFGFRSPVGRWLLEGETLPRATDLLLGGECMSRDMLDPKKLSRFLKKVGSARSHSGGDDLWRWLSTELWLRQI